MPNVQISFLVQGHINQTISLNRGITPEQLVAGLNSGKYFTTVQENGDVILLDNGHESVIGKVTSVDNECSYTDFELRD